MRLVGARVSTPDAPPASSRAAAARDWAARRPGYQQAEVAQAAAKREGQWVLASALVSLPATPLGRSARMALRSLIWTRARRAALSQTRMSRPTPYTLTMGELTCVLTRYILSCVYPSVYLCVLQFRGGIDLARRRIRRKRCPWALTRRRLYSEPERKVHTVLCVSQSEAWCIPASQCLYLCVQWRKACPHNPVLLRQLVVRLLLTHVARKS